jgi:opacity protein-like surface antigen
LSLYWRFWDFYGAPARTVLLAQGIVTESNARGQFFFGRASCREGMFDRIGFCRYGAKSSKGRKKNMIRKVVVAAILGILVTASGAMAQEGRWQEIGVQGTGFFTKDSSGNGINQHATDTGGFLVSYRYHFNRWLAADASYGFAPQQDFSSSGPTGVQANVHQATGALVITAPRRVFKLHPYVLAGAGALVFDPTGNLGGFVSGAQSQTKAAFVYGGGADYDLSKHFTLRAEYRGFVYERPDFGLDALHSGATAHTAQPSAGIVFRF